jgi:Flp pilus assembly protein TadD
VATAKPLAPPAARSAEAANAAGRALLQSGQFEEAVREFDKALAGAPDHLQALNGRGYAYLRLRRLEEAIADLEHALRVNPDYQNARTNLEAARRAKGR